MHYFKYPQEIRILNKDVDANVNIKNHVNIKKICGIQIFGPTPNITQAQV